MDYGFVKVAAATPEIKVADCAYSPGECRSPCRCASSGNTIATGGEKTADRIFCRREKSVLPAVKGRGNSISETM